MSRWCPAPLFGTWDPLSAEKVGVESHHSIIQKLEGGERRRGNRKVDSGEERKREMLNLSFFTPFQLMGGQAVGAIHGGGRGGGRAAHDDGVAPVQEELRRGGGHRRGECKIAITCTASLSHLRTMLPKSSSCPKPAQRPNHAT